MFVVEHFEAEEFGDIAAGDEHEAARIAWVANFSCPKLLSQEKAVGVRCKTSRAPRGESSSIFRSTRTEGL